MKYKIVNSFYDEDAGVSVVTIQNKYGHFTGFTKIKEQDKANQSSYAGMRFAEQKAVINFLKSQLKTTKIQIKTLKDYYNSTKEYSKSKREILHYDKYMWQLQKKKEHIEQDIKHQEEQLQNDIKERDRTLANYARLKEKKNKYKEGL